MAACPPHDSNEEHKNLVHRHYPPNPPVKQQQQQQHQNTSPSKNDHHHQQQQQQHQHPYPTVKTRYGAILFCISSWYISSLVTLFMNKWFMLKESGLNGSPQILAMAQMIFSALTGALKNFSDNASSKTQQHKQKKETVSRKTFLAQVIFLGIMRFGTVVLGLVALEHLAVSFTETIKSSAPFVTVLVTKLILGDATSTRVLCALLPIAFGLALCSYTEVSFNAVGFAAAMSCNCIDCIQNVYSKRLLRFYTPVQLQFYASVAALAVQMPLWFVMLQMSIAKTAAGGSGGKNDDNALSVPSKYALAYLCIDGLFFYIQSVSAYALMDLISPVSHSVCNCVKRALLIWISVLFWHNQVGLWNGVGTLILLGGVLLYNHQVRQQQQQSQDENNRSEKRLKAKLSDDDCSDFDDNDEETVDFWGDEEEFMPLTPLNEEEKKVDMQEAWVENISSVTEHPTGVHIV